MVHSEKCIVVNIDGTLCPAKKKKQSYEDLLPYPEMVEQIKQYKVMGFYIILYTARNMRTYSGNIGLINANTAKFTVSWLDRYQAPYHEIFFGKPWPGNGDFYVDDRVIRPLEFLSLSYDEIQSVLERDEVVGRALTKIACDKDME